MKKLKITGKESKYARLAAMAAAGIGGMGRIFRDTSTRSVKSSVRLIRVESITPGRNHAWCESNVGLIRKPIGSIPKEMMADYNNA